MSDHPRALKLGPRFDEAFRFAEKHSPQTRKKTEVPYISHLVSVAVLVLEAGGDEDQAIAAWIVADYRTDGELLCNRLSRRKEGGLWCLLSGARRVAPWQAEPAGGRLAAGSY